MDDQKLENLLLLSLDATQSEREKSQVLSEGYDPARQTWELILKYTGDFSDIAPYTVFYTLLLNQYAIAIVEQSRLDALSALPSVEYIEKPKRLFFALRQGLSASCFTGPASPAELNLTGEGTFAAIVDSGIDIFHEDFRNADGTTRIAVLWDQTIAGDPPEGYGFGSVYTRDELNELLAAAPGLPDTSAGGLSFGTPGFDRPSPSTPGYDASGHGTVVAGIAAGNGRESGGQYRGGAPEAQLIIVKLGAPDARGFPRTTQLMAGVDFAVRYARAARMPAAVNISFGNNYGPHNGTSLLERFLNDAAGYWKTVIVAGAGNEGAARGHTDIQLTQNGPARSVSLAVGNYETGLNLQIWKQYTDTFGVQVRHPSGQTYDLPVTQPGPHRARLVNTLLLVYIGSPSPYSTDQELFIDFIPEEDYIDPGQWDLTFTPEQIVAGRADLWLPGGRLLNSSTGFYDPTPFLTLTIPSTAGRLVTVGAYDSRRLTYADFSGRGDINISKPDLAAPGVNITAPAAGGGYGSYTGTSMAAPFVTAAADLLMEWGIVRGNDPYLYGEKVKAYLRRGARQLPGFRVYPNPQLGYGALCLEDSLPTQPRFRGLSAGLF